MLAPLITKETAREYAARSQESRRRNKLRREAEQKARLNEAPSALNESQQDVTSAIDQLKRTRAQLVKLHQRLDKEEDANKIDRLCSAIAKLSELERVLSGRPLPGSHRPLPPRRVNAVNPGGSLAPE